MNAFIHSFIHKTLSRDAVVLVFLYSGLFGLWELWDFHGRKERNTRNIKGACQLSTRHMGIDGWALGIWALIHLFITL